MEAGEFGLIEKYFSPLARDFPQSLGLSDDAAFMLPDRGQGYVATTDMLVEGRHFLSDDPIGTIGRKALRVNVSDLIAKGAVPEGYFLSIAIPKQTSEAEIAELAAGLGEDQKWLEIGLFVGLCEKGGMVCRSGARPGDAVYTSGFIGDAGLGLRLLQGELKPPDQGVVDELIDKYRLPAIDPILAGPLKTTATASADVSDGLLADVGHIANASGVGIEIELAAIPISPASVKTLQANPEVRREELLTYGDDYCVVFTVPGDRCDEADDRFRRVGMRRIGRVVEGEGVRLLNAWGENVVLQSTGYTHF